MKIFLMKNLRKELAKNLQHVKFIEIKNTRKLTEENNVIEYKI